MPRHFVPFLHHWLWDVGILGYREGQDLLVWATCTFWSQCQVKTRDDVKDVSIHIYIHNLIHMIHCGVTVAHSRF